MAYRGSSRGMLRAKFSCYLLLLSVALDQVVEGKVEGRADDLFFVTAVPTVTRELIDHGRHESPTCTTSLVVAPMKYYSTKSIGIHVPSSIGVEKSLTLLKNDGRTLRQPVDII